jgi:hypothetical protein
MMTMNDYTITTDAVSQDINAACLNEAAYIFAESNKIKDVATVKALVRYVTQAGGYLVIHRDGEIVARHV